MDSKFPVIDVSGWSVADLEPRGDEEKTWLAESPQDGANPSRWLFKPVTSHDWGDQGEDWAEKIASEIGQMLGIPCATVQIAVRHGVHGLVSLNLAPYPLELQNGSLVLLEVVDNYRRGVSNVPGRPGHNLSNLRRALLGCAPPPASSVPDGFNAFDVFTATYYWMD